MFLPGGGTARRDRGPAPQGQGGKLHHRPKEILRCPPAAVQRIQRDGAGQRQAGIQGGLGHADLGHGGIIAPFGNTDIGAVAQQIGGNADLWRQAGARDVPRPQSLHQTGGQGARGHARQHGDFVQLDADRPLLIGQPGPDIGHPRL